MLMLSLPVAANAKEETEGQEVAKECWDKASDHTSAMGCKWKAATEMKKGLEKNYSYMLKEARQHDADMVKSGSKIYAQAPHRNEEAVKKSQKAFLKYMDAECERRIIEHDTSNIAGDAAAICQINLITERLRAYNE